MDNVDDPRLGELLDRLATVRADLEANSRHMDEMRQTLLSVTDELRSSRNQRDIRDKSAFAELEARLATLPVIEQAKGILIARTGCSAKEAFGLLQSASQEAKIPISEVAADTVRQAVSQHKAAAKPTPKPPRSPRAAGDSANAVA